MNWRFIGAGIVCCVAAANTVAGSVPYPPIFGYAPAQRFHPSEHSRFNLIDRELKHLIARRGDTNASNVFCASGFNFPNGNIRTIVIWLNKDQLYWWWGTESEEERKESISLWLAPYSNLKNAVEDGATLSGPTTLNRSQAKAAIEDCEQYGQKFLVSPFTPTKERSDEDDGFDDLGDL